MKEVIIITGGTGLLAINWALELRDKFDVYLVMNSRKIQLLGTKSLYLSLDSVDEIQNAIEKIKPNIVIHTVGLTSVEMCEANPELAHYTNVTLAENMAKVCSRLNISLVHISTDHLFSGNEELVREEHLTEPQNVYGKTKVEAELRVLYYYPESLLIRTNFYGWGTSYRISFSDMILNSLKKGKSFSLFYDVFYTPIFMSVLIQTVHDLLKVKASGIFHVVGDEKLSKYEFGKKIAKQFSFDESLIVKGSFLDQQNLIHRPYDMSISNKKVCGLLGKSLGNVDEHIKLLYQQYEIGLAQEIQEL